MQSQRVKALVKLLEDPNPIVFKAVRTALLKEGESVLQELDSAWENIEDDVVRQRIDDIIHKIEFISVQNKLTDWLDDGAIDLLYGAFLVARFQYPDIEYQQIKDRINELWRSLRKEVKQAQTPKERVEVMNNYFFNDVGFSKNIEHPFSHRNNCINDVLECLRGNHISLSILYSELSQRIGLPIRCVSLPQVLILCYLKDTVLDNDEMIDPNDILFYINPSNKGALLGAEDIKLFLEMHNFKYSESYYLPCCNQQVVRRLLLNMSFAFRNIEDDQRYDEVNKLIEIIDNYQKRQNFGTDGSEKS